MRKLVAMLMLASAVSVTGGCAQLVRGGAVAAQAAAPVTTDEEIALGRAGVQELLKQPGTKLYDDPKVNAYVTQIGREMAARANRPELPWTFYVVDAPEQNALSLPGGFIFVTTGALRAMQNEAQLAGVLGHEVGHVAARHGVDQLKRALVAQGILISALGTSPQAAQIAGQIAAELVLRGYGREAELEADRLGARYMASDNYDPRQLAAFLETLAKSGQAPAWLAPLETHPPIEQRLAQLNQVIASQHLKGDKLDAQQFLTATAPLQGGGAGH
ncbi:MAG TPA: M48 family metallopeptidase [Stenomitos sp.]